MDIIKEIKQQRCTTMSKSSDITIFNSSTVANLEATRKLGLSQNTYRSVLSQIYQVLQSCFHLFF